MSRIHLGIHCSLQPDGALPADGNVAISVDGRPIFAIAEERVSRRKYDGDFRQSLAYALQRTGIAASDVDLVGVSTFSRWVDAPDSDFDDIRAMVRASLGVDVPIHIARSHHEIHAWAAAAYCPEPDALVAVFDNEGSILQRPGGGYASLAFERTSYYRRRGDDLELIARDHFAPGEVGYGKAYSKVTRYLGFQSYQESGKTMGLAPFGVRPPHFPDLFARSEGAVTGLANGPDGLRDLEAWFASHGIALDPRLAGEAVRKRDADLAFWIQDELERSVAHRLRSLVSQFAPRAVALSGGVALNCVMNAKLREALPVTDIFVPPSPGDAGLAVGVLAWLERLTQGRIPCFPASPYMGGSFNRDETLKAVADSAGEVEAVEIADPVADCAERLTQGAIMGWVQGASEYGPRSLGARSIVADPRNPWMKEVLNNLVKSREWFRPYAPAVLATEAHRYFEEPFSSPYMMHTAVCKPACVRDAPAAVHVDGTARLQTVGEAESPDFFALIKAFGQRTGVPILLNTSFNLGGEPIVESPADAVRTLLNCPRLDLIYVGAIRIQRAAGQGHGSHQQRREVTDHAPA